MSRPQPLRASDSSTDLPTESPGAATAPVERHAWRTPLVEARAAGALCAVAGLVHLVVVPEHVEEWAPAGLFFVLVAAAQLWLGQALWRGTAMRVLPAAVVATSGIVALYVVSRTVGLPFLAHAESPAAGGHHSSLPVLGGRGNGMPIVPGAESGSAVESVGLLDLACVAAELGALALLVGLLPAAQQRSVTNLLLAVGVSGWLLWAAIRFL